MADKLYLRLEPYNPDARDADGDGIVQERTAWERPAGTRILNELGKEIERGVISAVRNDRHSVVDSNGSRVDYIPSYAKQAKLPVEKPKLPLEKRGAQTIQSRGVRNLDQIVTEAVALSRASAPRESLPPVPSRSVTAKRSAPGGTGKITSSSIGPNLVSDLAPRVAPIQLLRPARKDGFQPASRDVSVVSKDQGRIQLFGWEETDEGREALDAIMEAGDRALEALEILVSGETLSEEIRQEIARLYDITREQHRDRTRIQKEISRLTAQSWLDSLGEMRLLLLESENGKPTESQDRMSKLLTRVEKRVKKLDDTDAKTPELITSDDMNELSMILAFERRESVRRLVMRLEPENYGRWFSSDGTLGGVSSWSAEIEPDNLERRLEVRLEEEKRQSDILARHPFPLLRYLGNLTDGSIGDRFSTLNESAHNELSRFVITRGQNPAKHQREDLLRVIRYKKFGQEIKDLRDDLQKPSSDDSPRQRLSEIDPFYDSEAVAVKVLDLLRSVRSDMGTGDFLGYFDQSKIEGNGSAAGLTGITKQTVIDAVVEANSKLPGSWVKRFRENYGPGKKNGLRFQQRGHFSSGEIRLSVNRYGWKSVLIHEVTHGFESSVPGLYLAERLFYNRRARSIPAVKLKRKYYGTGQYYWDLGLDDNYTSVYYADDYLEIATMSTEALLAGDIRKMPPDQAKFILGCMLLL